MKKIMFNGRYGLTQAVIDGRKTMTRRIEFDKEFQKMIDDKIYAYVAEIFGEPVFWDRNWCLIVDVIWRDNGCPLREKLSNPLLFRGRLCNNDKEDKT